MQPEVQQSDLKASINNKTLLGEKICQTMIEEIAKLGFAKDIVININFDQLSFSLSHDSYAKNDTLEGLWTNALNNRTGSIVFHGDGTFYAEHDVLQAHPTDKRWFVEAVTAWGKGDSIKTEPRLLPFPE